MIELLINCWCLHKSPDGTVLYDRLYISVMVCWQNFIMFSMGWVFFFFACVQLWRRPQWTGCREQLLPVKRSNQIFFWSNKMNSMDLLMCLVERCLNLFLAHEHLNDEHQLLVPRHAHEPLHHPIGHCIFVILKNYIH